LKFLTCKNLKKISLKLSLFGCDVVEQRHPCKDEGSNVKSIPLLQSKYICLYTTTTPWRDSRE